MESFTEQETQILLNFCSNTDKRVFVLKNLPEAIKGALFSRYSRSTKSLRRLLLDEFLSSKESGLMELVGQGTGPDLAAATLKAEEFYNRVLDGFGDDSVGELGGAHVAIEDVSIVSTKTIEDARVGGSPLEKSTRYVYFDQKRDGKWLYYREPAIMASTFADEYSASMDSLFETYARLVPTLTKYVEEAIGLRVQLMQRLAILEKERLMLKESLMDLTEKRLIKDIDRREFSDVVVEHRRKVNVLDNNIKKCKELIDRLQKTSFGTLSSAINPAIASTEDQILQPTIESTPTPDASYQERYYQLKQQYTALQEGYEELKSAVERLLTQNEL